MSPGERPPACWRPIGIRSGRDAVSPSLPLCWRISLQSGDTDTAAKIVVLGENSDTTPTPDASWLQILVKHRQFVLARELALKHWQDLGFTESKALAYVDEYPRNVAEFLPSIAQPEVRFAVGLLLSAAADERITDPVARRRDRRDRVRKAAIGYRELPPEFVPHQLHLLGLISEFPTVADEIPEAFAARAATYSIADYQAGVRSVSASNRVDDRSQIYLTHLRQRVSQEGAPAVRHFTETLREALPDFAPPDRVVALDAGAFIAAIKNGVLTNWRNFPQDNLREIAKLYREFVGEFGLVDFILPSKENEDGESVNEVVGTFGFLGSDPPPRGRLLRPGGVA